VILLLTEIGNIGGKVLEDRGKVFSFGRLSAKHPWDSSMEMSRV
jgi:hypothetical protein